MADFSFSSIPKKWVYKNVKQISFWCRTDWHDGRCDWSSKPISDGKVGDKGKICEIMR